MKKKLQRLLAAFFIVNILFNTFLPTISFALTSGPTAPEATSFEPVDTTDMVNNLTGDFTYNMPLLEVPGPAGTYPLSLSYHAGIQPNEDASWVGLGWTLNPGAITRLTNGVPDDFDGSPSTNRIFWEGGDQTTTSIGVSIGIANCATVSAGLSFSQDTYRGFGVGGYLGVSVGPKLNLGGAAGGLGGNLGINATIGISPYGDAYASVGISLSIGTTASGINASAGAGLSVNSSGNFNAGAHGGVGLSGDSQKTKWRGKQSMGSSLLGASINSGGGGGVLSAGGFTSAANNSKEGKISTSEDSWSVDIPVWVGVNINLSRSHVRYWMDETVGLNNYGALNFPQEELPNNAVNVYDSYHVQGTESIKTGNNPQKYLEGSFADYDQYSVSAQGVAGNIRPYHYILSLYSQDVIKESDGSKDILNYNIPQHAVGVKFRFVNDFSNKVINSPPDFEYNKTYDRSYWTTPSYSRLLDEWKERVLKTVTVNAPLFFPLSDPQTGLEDASQKRYVPNVPGSKHVEYFSNREIVDYKKSLSAATVTPDLRPRGFIDCNAQGFNRDASGLVGAFTITNQSGVKYHFSLPAYAFDEFTYSGSVDEKGKLSYNVISQPPKYAYTWYLTGITGPDYVDRGPNGAGDNLLNEYDWGYWVDFQYGLWTSSFQWRNPTEGFNQDVDHRFKSFSMGKKEVYYLNAIKTKTHTALFVKEIRADGKAVDDISYPVTGNTTVNQSGELVRMPKSSMRLNKIMIFNNSDISTLNLSSGNYGKTETYTATRCTREDTHTVCEPQQVVSVPIHNGNYVLDEGDLASIGTKISNSIRQVDFAYDYSLTPNTFNSFDPTGSIYAATSIPNPASDYLSKNKKNGKLTLKAVIFKGKGGVDFLPPTKFSYDITNKENLTGYLGSINLSTKTAVITILGLANQFVTGDLFEFNQSGKLHHGYVTNSNSGSLDVKLLSSPSIGQIEGFSKTKNPPYNKDLTDIWGMYKCDYEEIPDSNLDHYTSEISAKNTDVWSLREILSSTGSISRIEYETDTFGESVLRNLNVKIESAPPSGGLYCTNPDPYNFSLDRWVELTFKITSPANVSLDFTKRYQIGESVDIAADIGVTTNFPFTETTTRSINEATVVSVSKDELRFSACVVLSLFDLDAGLQRGKASLKSSSMSYGGGIRVKKLSLSNPSTGESTSTNYIYDFDGVSSGVTSFEPVNQYVDSKLKASFNQDRIIKTLSLARDIPAPGVFYKKVRVGETIQHPNESVTIPGYSDYTFEVFTNDMIDYSNSNENTVTSTGTHKGQQFQAIKTKRITLKDFTQRVGKLKSVTLYDKDGRKLNETINHYLHEEESNQFFSTNASEYENLLDRFNKQGVIQETFNHARLVKRPVGNGNDLQGIISKKESYPAVQTGTTSVNYKTGIKTQTKTLAFDFYNGNVSKSLETDGYGNSYVTETTYAYSRYPAMGLKSDYYNNNSLVQNMITNKHMLEQQAGSRTYKVASSSDLTPLALISASAQTWSDQTAVMGAGGNNVSATQPGIWRMKSSFSFVGDNAPLAVGSDGLQPLAGFQPFANWTTHQEMSGWQKNSEITLYDYNSHAIEATDVNGNYAATKFDNNHAQVLATAANASYKELAYSGAEETAVASGGVQIFGGGVVNSGSGISTSYHTGTKSVISHASTRRGFTYKFNANAKTYNVSVWANRADAKIKYKLNNGVTLDAVIQPVKQAGGWALFNAQISVASNNTPIEIWCEANGISTLFDDFRVHPVDAAMTSYVYNNWGELTHILDNNNLYTKYVYDEMGRLKETYKETFQTAYGNQGVVKVSEFAMNYGLNSPYTVSLQITKTGGSGAVSPVGNVNVMFNTDQTVTFSETCSSEPQLLKVSIDGVEIPLGQPSYILKDGSVALVSGTAITFKKMKSNHTLAVEYNQYAADAGYRCEQVDGGSGAMCNTGAIEFGTYDQCGNITWRVRPWPVGNPNKPNCPTDGSDCQRQR